MKTLIICGSIAKKSHTRAILKHVEDLLQKQRVEVTFWDLREQPLSFALPEYHHKPLDNPDTAVQQFVQAVMDADGIVLGSPLYHGTFSGVLKNAIDHLHYDAFRNKPVGLVSHGSGERSCLQPCEYLRTVVRTLYGYALQTQLGSTNTDYKENDNEYELVGADMLERSERFTQELITLTELLGKKDIAKED
jgi:azobenzene reductase